ncbi:MAG TPA: GntR family transcriptional regulator [Pseudolysinimonas sp.]|jgi:DNA-binding GntR family transcriptional regulator
MSLSGSTTARPSVIYDALRAAILSQSQRPGQAVTESAVALAFGVSRPTAKIAIEQLVADGLLHREPNAAARVPTLGPDDIRDVFDNRAIVESAVSAALARTGAVPPAAVAAQRELLRHPGDFAPFDIAFHRALGAGQPSPRLARLHALLMGEVELGIGQVHAHHLLDAATVAAQHQGILDAIIAGDPALAARLTRDHIDGARDALLIHLTPSHDSTAHGDD